MDFHPQFAGAAVARSTTVIDFIDPSPMVHGGIWTLFVAATAFLGLRLWCKIDRRHGLWYDDYILIASWVILLADCILISLEFATGYVVKTWDDRMTILVSTSSVLTTVGQAWTKTAFAVTLLRPGITDGWKRCVLWFIVGSINIYMVITFTLQWTNYCGQDAEWWKFPNVCVQYEIIAKIKTGRNMYNIMTDFALALFPWLVTWNLRIKKIEKIGICVTMSLGVFVAIISAWRTAYMMSPDMNTYDAGYFQRQGLSMVWFQAEVAGTIIVQTLPIIRHLARDKNQSKTLVSVQLNDISSATTHVWSETDKRYESGQGSISGGRGWKDEERGLRDPEPKKPRGLRGLGSRFQATRSSWSTYERQ